MTNEELKQKIDDVFVDYISKTTINSCAKIAIDFAIEELLRSVKLYHTSNSEAMLHGGKTKTIGEIVAIKINELKKQKEEL